MGWGEPHAPITTTATLTAEMLEAAIEKIKEYRPPCGSTPENRHVVHPRAHGWTRCGNCFVVVWVP